jgi:hypothetical protein
MWEESIGQSMGRIDGSTEERTDGSTEGRIDATVSLLYSISCKFNRGKKMKQREESMPLLAKEERNQ